MQVYPKDFKNAQNKMGKVTASTGDEHLTAAEKETIGLNPNPDPKVKVRSSSLLSLTPVFDMSFHVCKNVVKVLTSAVPTINRPRHLG
jgi:hypothetical protein